MQSKLERAERSLKSAKQRAAQSVGAEQDEGVETRLREEATRLQEVVDDLKATEERLRLEESRRLSRIFAFLEGRPAA